MLQNFKYKYELITFIFMILLSSCGSQKQLLYNPVEVKQLSQKLGIQLDNSNKDDDKNMYLYAQSSLWLGAPYRYGGMTTKGVDCSGLAYNIYKAVYQKNVSRDSDSLQKSAKKITKNNLEPGDLVFFATSKDKKKITHVGIYLKDNKFIHASTTKGVIVSDLNETYYKKNWKGAGKLK